MRYFDAMGVYTCQNVHMILVPEELGQAIDYHSQHGNRAGSLHMPL